MAEWLTGFPPYAMGATVVHRDEKFLLGGWKLPSKIFNCIWKLTDEGWLLAREDPPWGVRCYFSAVSFRGRIWIVGGYDSPTGPTKVRGDVWSSPNGTDWEQEDDPPWEPREAYGLVVHKNRMVLIGGCSYGPSYFHAMDDVWAFDGEWKCLTEEAPWGPRRGFGCVSYKGRIWVFGGFDSNGDLYDDVWSSPDGIEWERESEHAPWGPRGTFATGVFDNRIWLCGGNIIKDKIAGADDVWAYNGKWELVTENAGWGRRVGTQLFADGQLTLVGGFTRRSTYQDTWTSPDGEHWTKEF